MGMYLDLDDCVIGHPEARKELSALRAENAELNQLFDLQYTRMGEATEAWQKAHPDRPGVFPDLGALLTWMLAENERLREALVEAQEAMEERRGYCEMWEYKYGERWDKEDELVRAVLAGEA